RLRLIRFTPTRFAFEIARKDHKRVEVTYDLDAKRFDEVQRSHHFWRAKLRQSHRARPCRHLAADHRGDRDNEPRAGRGVSSMKRPIATRLLWSRAPPVLRPVRF